MIMNVFYRGVRVCRCLFWCGWREGKMLECGYVCPVCVSCSVVFVLSEWAGD